jgi:hypothetical protein
MALCAQAAAEKEKETVKEEVEKEVVTPAVEKPKYGGVLKLASCEDIAHFDEVLDKAELMTKEG